MDLFEESKSNEFQIVKVFIDHDLEDVALNDSFCGFVGAQVIFSWNQDSHLKNIKAPHYQK